MAGFCFALIVFILGWSVASSTIGYGVTWAQLGVLLTGIASALFVASSEYFLMAKSSDVWSLPDRFEESLRAGFRDEGGDWDKIKDAMDDKCKIYVKRGRKCYNGGVFLIFIGLWFVIAPYNIFISSIVVAMGLGLEIYELYRS